MDEVITLSMWDATQNKEVQVVTTLENIIKNPSGFRMDHVGVLLLNKERKALGLTEYRFNYTTGTFDEVQGG